LKSWVFILKHKENNFQNPGVFHKTVCRGFFQPGASVLGRKVEFISVVGKKENGFRCKTELGIIPGGLA